MENKTPAIYNDCAKILVSEQEISAICDRLAAEIQKTYENSGRRLVMVVILKGSMPFAADLMKRLTLPLELEFMKVSSYGAGTKTSGEIKVSLDLNRDDRGFRPHPVPSDPASEEPQCPQRAHLHPAG